MSKKGSFITVLSRELAAYFNSTIAYIFAIVFVMLTSGLYMAYFFVIGNADMRNFFSLLPIVLSIFIPALTMRLWAEERKGNTLELLLTLPMKTYQLVAGKFLACLVYYIFSLAGTFLIPVMLAMVGRPDWGPIAGAYMGAILTGAFYIAIGIFISGLCRDQIVAFILSMLACFALYLIGLDYMASTIDGWMPGVGSFLKVNLGTTRHFSGFEKGVVDIRDVLYFIVVTAVFLVLNILGLEDRMKPRAKMLFAGSIGVSLGIVLAANALVSGVSLGRFDLTQNKIYTVTPTAQNILQALKTPVQVKFYVSPKEKMPTTLKSLEQDVIDKLDELAIISKGRLQYKVFHMESVGAATEEGQTKNPEAEFERELQNKGISPFQVQSIEEDELGIKVIYSALAIAYKEKPEQTIPRVVPQILDNFEYEIMSKIFRLTLDKTPKVALVAPFEEQNVPSELQELLRQMGQSSSQQYLKDDFSTLAAALRYEEYDFARIRLTENEPIPEGTNTLIIVSPMDFSERQRYEVLRFLAGGGNVFLAAQSYIYDYSPTGSSGITISPREIVIGVNEILGECGIKISDRLLMDDQNEVINISGAAQMGPFAVSVPVKAPMQISVTEDLFNKEMSMTTVNPKLFYLWGSSLEIDNEKIKNLGFTSKVLFTSSKASWTLPYENRPLSPNEMEKPLGGEKGEGLYPLALLVEGQFPDIYKDKNIPAWKESAGPEDQSVEKVEEKAPALATKPGKLIVVGCSKMFEDNFVKSLGMLDFYMNSIDVLALGGELIHIRGHASADRMIEKVSKQAKLGYRFLTMGAVPLALMAFGIFRTFKRRNEKKNYLAVMAETGEPV